MIRKLIIILSILVPVFSIVSYANYSVDDRSDLLYYSSRSVVSDSSFYSGTCSSLSNGNSCSFPFTGSEIAVYLASYRNSGSVIVFIDGIQVFSGSISPTVDYSGKKLFYSTSDLSSGDHLLTIVCPENTVRDAYSGNNTAGRVYIDYFLTESDVSADYSTFLLVGIFFCCFITSIFYIFDVVRRLMALWF